MPVLGQLEEFVSALVSTRSNIPTDNRIHTRLSRNIRPILRAPGHIVVIIHLIELRLIRPRALNRSIDMAIPYQRLPNLRIRIRVRGARHDARVLEKSVGIQDREQLERLFKIIHHLLRGHVVGVAGGVKGADAGTMLAPLVLPEGFVLALEVFPVDGHVVQEVVAVEVFEDLGNIFVLAAFVAELLVRSITFIGPKMRIC